MLTSLPVALEEDIDPPAGPLERGGPLVEQAQPVVRDAVGALRGARQLGVPLRPNEAVLLERA